MKITFRQFMDAVSSESGPNEAKARLIALMLAISACVNADTQDLAETSLTPAALAEKTGLSKRTVTRYLDMLRDEGWSIERIETHGNHLVTVRQLAIPGFALGSLPRRK